MTLDSVAERAMGMAAESLQRRKQFARRLADVAGTRSRLEAARDALVDRLRHRSDDFEATIALELITEALTFRPPVEDFKAVVGYNPPWQAENGRAR
jgi:hypothetical protein